MESIEEFNFLTRKPLRALQVLIILENSTLLSQGEMRYATGLSGGTFHNHLLDFMTRGFVMEKSFDDRTEQYVYTLTRQGHRACCWLREYLNP